MLKSLLNRLDVKISFTVTVILVIVIILGTLYMMGQQGERLEAQLLHKGKIESILGAKMVGRVIEEAIDNEVFSVTDAFDETYVRIPNHDPAKFKTMFDSYLDKSILSLEDEFLKDESVVYAVAVDRNGYLPTHHLKYQKPPTKNDEKDAVDNRTKRIFNDEIGLKAARNTKEGLLQKYDENDRKSPENYMPPVATDENMWDISSPITVKGKHWGSFRVGISLQKLSEAKKQLTLSLMSIMAAILIISTVSVFLLTNRLLKPLKEFISIASDLASGKVEEKIEVKSDDELGQLANVLERLRVSIKTAMDKLLENK